MIPANNLDDLSPGRTILPGKPYSYTLSTYNVLTKAL